MARNENKIKIANFLVMLEAIYIQFGLLSVRIIRNISKTTPSNNNKPLLWKTELISLCYIEVFIQ